MKATAVATRLLAQSGLDLPPLAGCLHRLSHPADFEFDQVSLRPGTSHMDAISVIARQIYGEERKYDSTN
jgi:hypothetical protein